MSEALEADKPSPPADRTTDRTPPAPPGPPDEYATNQIWLALLLAAGVALWVFAGWMMLVVVLGIGLMITLHELGHFLTAKASGMKVTEFFFGFGPRLWSFRRGETEYGFKPIPAGAYVRIVGMNNLDEVAPEDEPRTYRQQSFPKRLIVVLAGPATHFVLAWIIIFVLLAVTGVPGGSITGEPDPERWVVQGVTPDSAASAAGLEPGDRVVAFDGDRMDTFDQLTSRIRETDVGEEVTLTVLRDGREFDTTTEIVGRPEEHTGPGAAAGSPFLGVGETFPDETLGVVEALGRTTSETGSVVWLSIEALGRFFSPSGLGDFADSVSEGSSDGSEPSATSSRTASGEESDDGRLLSIIGAVQIGAQLGEESLAGLLSFFLSINIFVGLVNLVPLLPFDGGHASVAIYERIRSRRGRRYHADVTKLLPVAYAVVMGLIVLGVTTMYLDIVNPVEL